ncbi:hypothetical protein GCM10010303_64310 [Streptomyces purpurascens]|nr:hypothetical protein GCM10010303_64310 [Streptomyces purpurascens]
MAMSTSSRATLPPPPEPATLPSPRYSTSAGNLRCDEDSNLYVGAPDRRVRLGHLPEGEDNGLWRINACNDSLGPPA